MDFQSHERFKTPSSSFRGCLRGTTRKSRVDDAAKALRNHRGISFFGLPCVTCHNGAVLPRKGILPGAAFPIGLVHWEPRRGRCSCGRSRPAGAGGSRMPMRVVASVLLLLLLLLLLFFPSWPHLPAVARLRLRLPPDAGSGRGGRHR